MSKLSRSELESRIKSIVAEVTGYDKASLTVDTSLNPEEHSERSLSVGSLELAELLIILDEEFSIHIPDEVVSTLNTIKSLVDYLEQHIV